MDSSSVETRLFINNEFRPSSNNETFDLLSARSGKVFAKVHEASDQDVNFAVSAAKTALEPWSELSWLARGRYLARLADAIKEAEGPLGDLEAECIGRPKSTYFDAAKGSECFRYFSQAPCPQGRTSPMDEKHSVLTVMQPVGVVAVIIPWNAPLIFFSKKVAPALAAGNTVVVKSSEKAPLTSLYVARLAKEAGFPPGVLNVLSGHGPNSGKALASHMDVRALSFTGSMRTGKDISVAAANSNLKNLILELGGKSPAIIFEDANIEDAAKDTAHSIQFLSGQNCMANSRIYVQQSIKKIFIEKFQKALESVRLGDPMDPQVNHGPQADKIQYNTVKRYIEEGKKTGKLVTKEEPAPGFFIRPVVFTGVPENAKIMKEEIFGPVAVINSFETEEEAVEKANDSEYGLYASVYTNDLNRAHRVSLKLQAGTVGVNCTGPTKGDFMPFGGQKGSGLQREGYLESMLTFMEPKAIILAKQLRAKL
ncbi:hypothetical protein TGAMA5MH_00842 [Trichoderma gamsii]|uniref:aldehyde dehydrogenase (NAD(+)) n=2 Tax=Trichoderma gamsii TaxID=398673 RepID=A0A2K0TR71_9HYPO|nr:hypothetical protein TGAMA5MH_00842 [Trichoderma gamsii]